jgi:hypothetical protein
MLENWGGGGTLLRVGITFVLIGAVFSARQELPQLLIKLLIVAIAAPVLWLTMLFDENTILFIAGCVLDSAFFAVIAVLILSSVLQKHLATMQSIYGAVCAYLLLGLAWAMLYWALDRNDPNTLSVPAREAVTGKAAEINRFSEIVYFSFVTMSTLGYGDIYPRTAIARTLAWMQSVTGLFYIAVVVAWLVSEIPRRKNE